MMSIDLGNVLLAANIGELLGILVPIVFFIIYALNQLLAAKGNPQQQQRRAAGQRAERALQNPAQANPQGGGAQLNSEIEQFLKRAGQKRAEGPPRQRAARAQPAPKAPPKPPPAPARQASGEVPLDVEPLARRDFDTVAESVQEHIGTRSFEQRAEHLADDITRADEQMEAHLQRAFGHRVGTLAGGDAAQAAPVTDVQTTVVTDAPSAAAAFAMLLRTPQGMQQAIVASEILARPEDRW
jgi:hypothetical protein